jgi:hypothetical protein
LAYRTPTEQLTGSGPVRVNPMIHTATVTAASR